MQNNEHQDYQIKDGVKYWSPTACLKIVHAEDLEFLRGKLGNHAWKELMLETSSIGTILHDRALEIFKAKGFFMYPSDGQYFDALDPMTRNLSDWMCENVLDIKHVEETFFCEELKTVGRIDGLYLLKGKKGYDLGDIKTGTTRSYKECMQLACYKQSLKENGIEVNDRIIIECKRPKKNQVTGEYESKAPKVKAIKIKTNYKTDLLNFRYAKSLYLAMLNNKI
jgi:hypothetical protein